MTIICANSAASDARTNARDLLSQIASIKPTFVLFFVSSNLDPEAFASELANSLGEIPSIGCTTAGEVSSGKMSKGTAVLMAFDSTSIRAAHVACVSDCTQRENVRAAVDELEDSVGAPVSRLNPAPYVGLVLHDGMTATEELVMSVLSEATNVPFVGGTAGDDLKFTGTNTFINFKMKEKTTVLSLLEPLREYRVLKTQSFRLLDKLLVATDVEEEIRAVHSFNGKPAFQEYAAQLGVSTEEALSNFLDHPVGLTLPDGEPFVRSPARVEGDTMIFYCRIKQGMKLSLLESEDIVAQTKTDLAKNLKAMKTCSAVLNFHCILRTLQLENAGLTEAYGNVFMDVPTVGFSTYSESYIGPMTQTSTMILFG